MKARLALTIWIFVASIATLIAGAETIAGVRRAFPDNGQAMFGPRVPAFTAAVYAQSADYPTVLVIAAIASIVLALYFWRSSRPFETKAFAATLLAAINMSLAASLTMSILVAYFMLPKLANGS